VEEKLITAYHEAGHAIACLYFGDTFEYATIRDSQPMVANPIHGNEEQCFVTMLAGPAVEYKLGHISVGDDNLDLFFKFEDEKPRKEAKFLFDKYTKIANLIFTSENGIDTTWWRKTILLAEELHSKETMSYQEVYNLVMNE